MKVFPTSAALGAVLIVVSACERRDASPAPAPAQPAGPNHVAGPADRTLLPEGVPFRFAGDETPAGFAQRMVMSDMFEIESSRLAVRRAQSAPVRAFAQTMVDAHTASTGELKATLKAQELAPVLPTALDLDHQRRMNDLSAATAQDFERVYLDQQTTAHQAALDELQDYAGQTGDAALKVWAVKTMVTVRSHLERVRTLDREGADRTATPAAEVLPK